MINLQIKELERKKQKIEYMNKRFVENIEEPEPLTEVQLVKAKGLRQYFTEKENQPQKHEVEEQIVKTLPVVK